MFPIQIHQLEPKVVSTFVRTDNTSIKAAPRVKWSKRNRDKVTKLMKQIGKLRKEGLLEYERVCSERIEYRPITIDLDRLSEFMHDRLRYFHAKEHVEIETIIMGKRYYQHYIDGVVKSSFYVPIAKYNFSGIRVLIDPLIDGMVFVRKETT